MMGIKIMGMNTVVPVAVLLAIGLFVQLSLPKISSKGLRKYALVVLCLLWLSAALYMVKGVYFLSKGKCSMMYKKPGMHMMK
ncbi:hypothetical protein ACFL2J_06510 [Candidatus Omnitrophota bacterium]